MKAFRLLSSFDFVTLHDVQHIGLETLYKVTKHCEHQSQDADWILNFDVDEVMSLGNGNLTDTKPQYTGGGDEIPAGKLLPFMETIPSSVLGILLPRMDFGETAWTRYLQLE